MDEHREMKVTPDRYVTYRYAGASGDFNPIHLDDEFARSVGLPGRILHGLWTMAQVARAQGDGLKLESLSVQFRGMGVPEQEITVTSTAGTGLSRPSRARTGSSGAARPSSANDVVAARGDLRDLPALVPGLGRRRRRRPARDRRAAAVPALARRRRDLADADLPVAAARLRLRHHRSHGDRPAVRDARGLRRARRARPRARPARAARLRPEPHVRPASVVPRPGQRDWYLGTTARRRTTGSACSAARRGSTIRRPGRATTTPTCASSRTSNWRNPAVREAMLGVLEFWIARGVDGFRVDAMRQLLKDPELRDNPPDPATATGMPEYDSLLPVHTRRPRRGAGGRGRDPRA